MVVHTCESMEVLASRAIFVHKFVYIGYVISVDEIAVTYDYKKYRRRTTFRSSLQMSLKDRFEKRNVHGNRKGRSGLPSIP